MNTVSPEDRLGLVNRQHDEWRQQAAFDRGMRASSGSQATTEVESAHHHRIQALRHLFHVPAWGHRAPRGMSH